jgi:hypothetical protein
MAGELSRMTSQLLEESTQRTGWEAYGSSRWCVFTCGEVVEGAVGLGSGTREGKQEPGGLRGEVARGLWK